MNMNIVVSKKIMISIMSVILIIMTLATMPLVAVADKPNNIDLSINISENIGTNVDTDLSNGIKGTGRVTHTPEEKNLPLTEPAVVLDNFNRPDGPIGSAWTEQTQTFSVSGNTAIGGDWALATYNGVSSNVVEADVQNIGTGQQYIGLVLGYNDLNNNLFLKVQNQDGDARFEYGACYVGNNGYGFGLGFFTLDSPFATAHMKTELVGNTVYITFSNIDGGSGTQTYTCSGAPSTGGSGIGINSWYRRATLDNFAAGTGASSDDMVFTRGTDNGIWYRTFDGTSWGAWTGLGGIMSGDPDGSTLNNKVYAFARGTDNALWYRSFDGTSWAAWTSLGGIINSAPGVSTWGNKLYVFARGTDNALWYRSFDGTSWTGWTSLGGIIGSGPGAS